MNKNKYSIRDKEIEKIKKRESFIRKRVSVINENPIDVITFVKNNGQKIVQNVNPRFLENHKGKPKSQKELVSDISAIACDLDTNYILM